jgi:hypothetical protein
VKAEGRWHVSIRLFAPMDLRGDTSQYFLPSGDMVEAFPP